MNAPPLLGSTPAPPPPDRAQRSRRAGWLVLFLLLLSGAGFVGLVGLLLAGRSPGQVLNVGERVAILEVNGVLLFERPILERIEEFEENGSIKAVVVRINSPGGGVAPSQEIYERLRELDREKPVIASFGGTAASGGYYIACGARKIVSNPGTLTGSIGVILETGNYQELLEKIGMDRTVIKSGPYKDILSPTRPVTDEERALVQGMVDNVYEQFIRAIVDGRGIEEERLRAVADGRILSGEQAFQAGLVDQLGTLADAVALAGTEAGLKGEPEVFYPKEPRVGLLDLLGGRAEAGLLDRFVSPRLGAGPGLYFLVQGF